MATRMTECIGLLQRAVCTCLTIWKCIAASTICVETFCVLLRFSWCMCVLHFWLSRLYVNLMWFHALLWLCEFGSSLLDVELSVNLTIILCVFVFYCIYLWQCVALWFLELVWIELRMIHDKHGIELGGWASVCAAPVVRWHVANIKSKLMSLRNHSTKSNVKRGPWMYLSCLICK